MDIFNENIILIINRYINTLSRLTVFIMLTTLNIYEILQVKDEIRILDLVKKNLRNTINFVEMYVQILIRKLLNTNHPKYYKKTIFVTTILKNFL